MAQQAEEIILRCRPVNDRGEVVVDQRHAVDLFPIQPRQQTGQPIVRSEIRCGGKVVNRHKDVFGCGIAERNQGIRCLPAIAQIK